MKKFKLLPTMLMLVLCVGVLAVGVFALTPTKNTISGSITINAANTPVKIEVFVDATTNAPIKTYNEVRSGEQIRFDEILGQDNLLSFDTSSANLLEEVPTRKLILRVTNLDASKQLGAYYLSEELAEDTLIKIKEGIYTEDQSLLVANAYLPSYAIIDKNNEAKTEEKATQDLELEFEMATWEESVGQINFYLYIEEYADDIQTNYEKTTGSVIVAPKEEAEGVSTLSTITPVFTNTTLSSADVEDIDFSEAPNVVITEGVEKLGYMAFAYKEDISDVVFPSTLVQIEDGKAADDGVFECCEGLTNITLPKNLTFLGDSAFCDCIGLEAVKFSNSLKNIRPYAFAHCSSLKEITIPNGVISIEESAFFDCSSLESIEIPNSVTSVGERVFSSCISLEEITIPFTGHGANAVEIEDHFFGRVFDLNAGDGLTEVTQQYYEYIEETEEQIQVSATYYIPTSLKKVNFTGSVVEGGAFSNCSMIEEVKFSKNIEIIKKSAFESVNNLTNIDLSNCKKLRSIGDSAFYNDNYYDVNANLSGCSSLSYLGYDVFGCTILTLNLNGCTNLNNVDEWAFDETLIKTVYFPSFTQWINFKGQLPNKGYYNEDDEYISTTVYLNNQEFSNSTEIEIPNGVMSIPYGAFSDFTSLKKVTISNSVTNIGDYAFDGCSSLTSIIIPNSVTEIGDSAFNGCSSLTNITIPNSVTNIGNSAFWGCSGLEEITVKGGTPTTFEASFPWSSIKIAREADDKTYTDIDKVYNQQGYIIVGKNYTTLKSTQVTNDINAGIQEGKDGTKIKIAEGVTTISSAAFNNKTTIKEIIIPNSVTSIGGSAFQGCSGLTNITIPNSVTSIEGRAFEGCSGLEEITVKGGTPTTFEASFPWNSLIKIAREADDKTYTDFDKVYNQQGYIIVGKNRTTLGSTTATNDINAGIQEGKDGTKIKIAEGVTTISSDAFRNKTTIKEIIIPNSVTNIGDSAFNGCSGLTSITIPNSVTNIGRYAFSGCSSLTSITIPNSVTSIEYAAFWGCSSLTNITIPNSVTSIGEFAFSGCSSLKSITIPNSVTSIGKHAFKGCSSLESIEIPNSVTEIGSDTFYGCSSLKSITIPNSVTNIGDSAFSYCSNLTSITIPNSVTSIGDRAFVDCSSLTGVEYGNCIYIGNTDNPYLYLFKAKDKNITSATIHTQTKFIGYFAFNDCSGLTNINIPTSVTSIGVHAFDGCSSLTSIEIPNSVTSIWEYAFDGCSSLTSIYIPKSVETLDYQVFSNCSNSLIVNCEAESQPAGWHSSWKGNDNIKVNWGVKK